MCICERDIMVTENFTHYNIFDSTPSKSHDGVVYQRMNESSNPSPSASCGADTSELLFHAVYNPRIPYILNRDYYANMVSHRHNNNNHNPNMTKTSDVGFLQSLRNMFCCGV